MSNIKDVSAGCTTEFHIGIHVRRGVDVRAVSYVDQNQIFSTDGLPYFRINGIPIARLRCAVFFLTE